MPDLTWLAICSKNMQCKHTNYLSKYKNNLKFARFFAQERN